MNNIFAYVGISIFRAHARQISLQLVLNKADAAVFLPLLLPGLKKAASETPNPEVRAVASKALAGLLGVAGVQDTADVVPVANPADLKVTIELRGGC